jgi:Domain of unknown function (DUF4168)
MKLPTSLFLSLTCCLAAPLALGTFGVSAAQASKAPTRVSLYQKVSDAELRKYAMALIEIEPLRVEALNTIQSQVGGQLPELMCNQPSSMDGLPGSARKVFVNYCNKADNIAKKHGLSQSSFNRITALVSSDSRVKERLQRQVSCIQSGSC